jgi:sensor domain CHASE-containing protein
MKPLADFAVDTRRAAVRPRRERVVRVTLVVCLLLGLGVVTWGALLRRDAVRARAGVEVLAQARALELQFSRAQAALEVLGALMKQSGGAPPNFQQVGTELISSHPGLASLEVQPGGVVADIVPRAGHEKVIGLNVLKDPASQVAAQAAIRARTLTVAGPVNLPGGQPGLVMWVPVFQRGRDGKEVFWGFAAASVRLPEALARAGVDELFGRGYGYLFYAPQIAERKAVSIAGHGWSSSRTAVEQPVRAGNLELRLAIQPRAGWFGVSRIVLESLGVVVLSVLLSLLVSWREKWGDLKATRAELRTRVVALTKDRDRIQNELWAAKEAAGSVRSQLQVAEKAAKELRERLDLATRALQETAQADAAKPSAADQTIRDLETQSSASETVLASKRPKTPKPVRQKTARQDDQLNMFADDRPSQEGATPAPASFAGVAPLQDGRTEAPAEAELEPQTTVPAPALPEPAVADPSTPAPSAPEEKVEDQHPAAELPAPAVDTAQAGPVLPPGPDAPAAEDLKPVLKPKEVKSKPRVQSRAGSVRLSLLRLAVKQITPLLIDQDPGAKDCLRDHRAVFRPAFPPELFGEFEQCVNKGELSTALEHLKKAVKKHGISV